MIWIALSEPELFGSADREFWVLFSTLKETRESCQDKTVSFFPLFFISEKEFLNPLLVDYSMMSIVIFWSNEQCLA